MSRLEKERNKYQRGYQVWGSLFVYLFFFILLLEHAGYRTELEGESGASMRPLEGQGKGGFFGFVSIRAVLKRC